jgi:hypothetical protein
LKPHLNRYKRFVAAFAMIFLSISTLKAQNISGYILNENNEPIAFANVFVKETGTGTSTDDKGKYFLPIDPGVYTFIFSSLGYKTTSLQIRTSDKPVIKNIWLQSSSIELNEIVVRANRRDPAYEVIQKVIDNKEKFLKQADSYRAKVYVRAMETVDNKKKKAEPEEKKESDKPNEAFNPVEAARKKEEARLQSINLVELQLALNYVYPDQYKEERTAYKLYGSKDGLYIPLFNEADFNFYHNLVHLKGISEVPLISPVSRLAILSYKFKLEEMMKEGEHFVYKIRVTPRKSGDATCKGFIFVNDSIWNINRIDLTLEKGALKFFDAFTIQQTYHEVDSGFWLPDRQEFTYQTKAGHKLFKGSTVIAMSEYQKNYRFPKNFFGDEVSVTTAEAYKRDSSYWNNARPDPLSKDQQKVIHYRDSIDAAHHTKRYLDSMETRFNKVTVGELLYSGVGFRREARKRSLYISPLMGLIGFEVIGGFRLGPNAFYYRGFENGRILSTSGSINVGLKNMDWQGSANFWIRYNPYKLGDFAIRTGRSFYSINSFDAYLNQLRISNYILHEHATLYHRIELLNGLYADAEVAFHNRRSVSGYDRTSIINKVIKENDPLYFKDYQALISHARLSYTPRQRFMTEPNRKVVLGSRYPTFILGYKKGWNNFLTSDINFDYVDFSIEQNLQIGTLGNSKYSVTLGKFMNTTDLRYVDLKRFRQSDPILYSDPLHSFQSLDTALSATNWFLEAHHIHHFNGAMINNIPFIKKTKLRTVGGAGMMWIQESNYRHQEIFGGVERVFKLGARRRLRIGLYGVLSQSNSSPIQSNYKISFDLIDTWRREWSY